MAEHTQSRRSAFKTLAFVAAGAAGLWRFLTPRAAVSAKPLIEIAASDVPPEGAAVLPQSGIAVVRTGGELHGVDLACTHLGCAVKATPTGFACPCHGSRFGTRGECVSGPAPRNLRLLAAKEEHGVIRVAPDEELEVG